LIESAGADNRLYLEALGVVLAHELARLDPGPPRVQAPIRGASRLGSSVSSPPISRSILPSRYRSPRSPNWFA